MRLIDADALPVSKEYCVDEAGWGANFYVVHKEDIDNAPAITPDSLRPKGRWEDRYDGKYANPLYVCSECGENALLKIEHYMFFRSEIVQVLSAFCPNCGADMTGGIRKENTYGKNQSDVG